MIAVDLSNPFTIFVIVKDFLDVLVGYPTKVQQRLPTIHLFLNHFSLGSLDLIRSLSMLGLRLSNQVLCPKLLLGFYPVNDILVLEHFTFTKLIHILLVKSLTTRPMPVFLRSSELSHVDA